MEVHGDNNQPFIDVSVGWANQIAVSVSKCVGIQHDTATIWSWNTFDASSEKGILWAVFIGFSKMGDPQVTMGFNTKMT